MYYWLIFGIFVFFFFEKLLYFLFSYLLLYIVLEISFLLTLSDLREILYVCSYKLFVDFETRWRVYEGRRKYLNVEINHMYKNFSDRNFHSLVHSVTSISVKNYFFSFSFMYICILIIFQVFNANSSRTRWFVILILTIEMICSRCRMETLNGGWETTLYRSGEKVTGPTHEGISRL